MNRIDAIFGCILVSAVLFWQVAAQPRGRAAARPKKPCNATRLRFAHIAKVRGTSERHELIVSLS